MKWINNNWFKVTVVVLFIGLGFYWFQLRPSEIRKDCGGKSLEYGKGNSDFGDINNFYRTCLIKNGMKPESMFVNLE